MDYWYSKPFKVASKKFTRIPHWNKKLLCPQKGTEPEQLGMNLLLVKLIFFHGSMITILYFLSNHSRRFQKCRYSQQVKLRHLLSTEIHAKRLLTRLQKMQHKAEEKVKFLRVDERNVKAIRSQWHQFMHCKGLFKMVSMFNGQWFFLFSETYVL